MRSPLLAVGMLELLALGLEAQNTGVSTAWDVRESLAALASQAGRLKPILDDFRVKDWIAGGAPETYLVQWKSAQDEIGHLRRTLSSLAAQPEKLTLTLEAFLRLEALEAMLGSLGEGVRKYQNPALGELLGGITAENAAGRDKLRAYLVELAAAKEEELRIADQEAQRCRSTLIRQPARPAKKEPE